MTDDTPALKACPPDDIAPTLYSEADQDDVPERLKPLLRQAADLIEALSAVPQEDQVERVARAIFDSHNATYTMGGLLVWESDPEHWRRYARAALRSSGIDGGE